MRTKEEINCDIARKRRELENLECELEKSRKKHIEHGDVVTIGFSNTDYLFCKLNVGWLCIWHDKDDDTLHTFGYSDSGLRLSEKAWDWKVKYNIFV